MYERCISFLNLLDYTRANSCYSFMSYRMKKVKDGNMLQLNSILLFHGFPIFDVMSFFAVLWNSLKLFSNVRRKCLPCIFPCVQYVKFSLHDSANIFFSTKFMIINFYPLESYIKNCESNVSFAHNATIPTK